ncbi:uncharacterized protein A1O5_12434 [Cladophialophora psammophila CBS 110553]|uniref:Uncharacterized protein n=1 Tax=Cladophialophora psammophila CBS 110553 TaxID=1182543 RepID=W9W057_9EURO|nr:uncharacterized protein A1O5_12434 [Cladophialophora psammophila CBS 110553]EXJ57876.1 hypothetical protein A1O5_12434 [Cladophialophora psammophila CBS 110553]
MGDLELVTGPTTIETIFEGVTRISVLDLVRGDLERSNSMREILQFMRYCMRNKMGESWKHWGQALNILLRPCKDIRFEDADIVLIQARGVEPTCNNAIRGMLEDIMRGNTRHERAVIVKEIELEN